MYPGRSQTFHNLPKYMLFLIYIQQNGVLL